MKDIIIMIFDIIETLATSWIIVAVIDQMVYDLTPWYGLRDNQLVWIIALIVFAIRIFVTRILVTEK